LERRGVCVRKFRVALVVAQNTGPLGHQVPQWHTGQLVGPEIHHRCGAVTAIPTRKAVAAMDLVAFLPLLIILGAFMFFASRRQKKAMQKTIDLHNSLQVGDRVHTTSGLQGEIKAITDDNVELEIAPGVVTTWMKLAVRDRVEADDDLDDDTDEGIEPQSSATEITDSSDQNRLN
jgi:preprotein translocase subunit YajC